MRLPRPRIENCCVHVTHRCQQRLFLLGTDVDRRQYVKRLWEASRRFPAVRVVDYGVTANHIHLLAWVPRMADHSRLSLGHGASPEPRRGDASPRTPRCSLAAWRTTPQGDCRCSRTRLPIRCWAFGVRCSMFAFFGAYGASPEPRRGDVSPRTPRECLAERRTTPQGDCRCSRTDPV